MTTFKKIAMRHISLNSLRVSFIAILLSSTWSLPLLAGGWSAGGGEIIGHLQNPWFLQNTKKVSYCIRGDYDHFSLSAESVSAKFKSALAYWRRQFAMVPPTVVLGIPVTLADQEFVEDVCPDNLEQSMATHDLVIQLGEVSEIQAKFLEDPRHFMAVSVRTDYDVENLKGKGFIYVSADSGALKYDKASLVDKGWSVENGALLERILIHELGHVFGLQHRGPTLLNNIMSAGFPEFVLLAPVIGAIRNDPRIADSIALSDPLDKSLMARLCKMSDATRDFFSVPTNLNCMVYKFVGNDIEVLAKATYNSDPVKVGVIVSKKVQKYPGEQLVKIGVTPAQKVFSHVPASLYDMGYLPGPSTANLEIDGEYTADAANVRRGQKSTTRTVTVTTQPNSLRIDGLMNGVWLKRID